MLRDIFPQLLRGEAAPENSRIWEISCFAVDPVSEPHDEQAPAHPVTLQILQKGYEAARASGIHQFVAVTSVAMERLLLKLGIPMQRFGDGKATRVGKVLSVAVRDRGSKTPTIPALPRSRGTVLPIPV